MSQRDLLIIGAGVLGAAVAYALAQRGLGARVLVLERSQPASGATSRSAAMLALVRNNPLQRALAQETLRALAHLSAAEGAALGRHTVGALHVASAAGSAALQALLARCLEAGIEGQWLEAEAARACAAARAPWLNPQSFDCAAFFPHESYLDPYLLTSAYLRSATQLGAKVQTQTAVAAVEHDGAAVRALLLADGSRIEASVVVNAAGAWANRLSLDTGLALPMAPVRSQYWITAPDARFARDGCIVLLTDIRAYARPEVGALLFGLREAQSVVADARTLPEDLGGYAFNPSDPEGWDELAAGAPALEPFFPALAQTPIAHYVQGPSNYTPDGQLIVGAHPNLAGLYLATGCNGAGVTCSGGVGRLIAELVCGSAPFVAPEAMNPARCGSFDPYAPSFLAACAAVRSKKTSG